MMGCGHLSTQIIRQIEPTTPLMQFTFTKRTLKNQSEANLDMAVMPLECIYNLQLVRRITEFIDPSEIDESLKTLAWTKVDTMRENTQQTVGELVEGIVTLRVKLDVQSPVLVVPFANSDECWVAHLGDLRMDTVTDEQESYTFELKDTSLQYFKSIEHYRICGTSGFGVL
jgi:vacuolar protein sorting-associated protein 13A/C